ncbi:transposase [Enterococcus sp. DIV0691]|uniref:transposase n=1 Tax=Enterococcus sp. DIV0691 TaxID=2774703 RepID=UPI003F684453
MTKGQTHEILDIVENRLLPYLELYFSRLSIANRKSVEFIIIDRYVSLIKNLFLNTQLLIDRFHIVQHIGRTFFNHRVKESNAWLKNTSQCQYSLDYCYKQKKES